MLSAKPTTSAEKWKKRQARYERWAKEEAAERALKIATSIIDEDAEARGLTPDQRQTEIDNLYKHVYHRSLTHLLELTAQKMDIKCRMVDTLKLRCGEALAADFIEMVDFKELNEATLNKVLIQIIQQPRLCANAETANAEWQAFVEPYHALKQKQLIDRTAQLEKAQVEVDKIARENAKLRAKIDRLKTQACGNDVAEDDYQRPAKRPRTDPLSDKTEVNSTHNSLSPL